MATLRTRYARKCVIIITTDETWDECIAQTIINDALEEDKIGKSYVNRVTVDVREIAE